MYADHHSNKCVERCPFGYAPDTHRDCHECTGSEGYVVYVNLTHHHCAAECPVSHQYIDVNECVDDCPAGSAPKGGSGADSFTCAPCADPTPYAFHKNHTCVDTCPSGSSPNSSNDCEPCQQATPYFDSADWTCVAKCPSGYAPDDANLCVPCSGSTPFADKTWYCVNSYLLGCSSILMSQCVYMPWRVGS